MQTLNLKLPAKLAAIFQDPNKDYRGAYGGRGAAKTIGFANMAIVDIIRLDEEPWKFLCGRELQKSLKDSVFSVIAGQIGKLGVADQFEVGKEYIRHKNGNEFLFYGLKSNIAEVKGLHGVRRTWLEEAQKVSNHSLEYLIPTVMRDFPDCEIWASWNPDDPEDPIHKMYTQDADDTFAVTKINYYDNPWFPESLDKVRLRDLKNKPDRYEWIWLGNFNVNVEGSVYAKWVSDDRIMPNLYDPNLLVHTAWDLGYSDETAIWFYQIVGNEVRCIDYYEAHREDMLHYASVIYGRSIHSLVRNAKGEITSFSLGEPIEEHKHRMEYQYGGFNVPHDANNKLLQAGGRSIVHQMYELGIKAKAWAATSQQQQINAARSMLNLTWFDKDRCKDGVRCLRKYAFKENDNGTYSRDPVHDQYSHGADALEIIAQSVKSAIITPEKPSTPKLLDQTTAKEVFRLDDFGSKSGFDRI